MEDEASGRGRGGGGARAKVPGTLMKSIPRTAGDWACVMARVCERLQARPLLASALDEVQRTLHLLIDGRKSVKSGKTSGLRKGDLVFTAGGDGDEHRSRRGVVESEHSDGTLTVKWHSPIQETTRLPASAVRPLNRITNVPPWRLPLNQFLVTKALPLKDARMVAELLREGADPSSVDEAGNSALAVAVSKGCPSAVLSALLQGGADPEAAGPLGTPLEVAIKNGDIDSVECLLEAGVDCSGVDTSEGSGCLEAIAEMVARHKAMVLPEEARLKVQEECVATTLPLLLLAMLDVADSTTQHNAIGFVSYIMDKASLAVLEATLGVQGGIDPLLRVLQAVESSDSLDVLYYAVRIMHCLTEKVPSSVEHLRSRGILRWVQRLSNAKSLRQDAAAGLLVSKTGRIKDKHVAKLAADIVSKASPTDAPIRSDVAQLCDALREGRPGAAGDLSRYLQSAHELTAADLASCDLVKQLLGMLSSPEGDRYLGEIARGGGTGALIQPLVQLVATEGQWGVTPGGGQDLQDLVKSMRIEMLRRDAHAAPGAAGATSSTSMLLNVEPMLLLSELERHILRTVHPLPDYLKYCNLIVGATILERPAMTKQPFASAHVTAFELIPPEAAGEPDRASAVRPAADSAQPPLDLDNTTLASCLTLHDEGGKTVITCCKKGSPAGTVQAKRAFSQGADGPLAYFEVLIKRKGPLGAIGVGLARGGYSKSKMPGWEPVSHAWHGDDGCIFNSCGTGTPFSNPWAEGDVIGCGIDFLKKAIFLTRNGTLQGAPFKGVETHDLMATIGCQTKGECVGVSFQPPFLYDVSAHVLTQPLVPVHHLRYADGSTRVVNLLMREYVIEVPPPSLGSYLDKIRACLASLLAYTQRDESLVVVNALASSARTFAEGGALDLPSSAVSAIEACEGGHELLAACGPASVFGGGPPPQEAVARFAGLCEAVADSLARSKKSASTEGDGDDDEASKRVHTVMIIIPDGFPPELFFEEVEDAVRMALSTPDPTVAPASGNVGDSYRWPDRGFEHEEVWYESLMVSLAEKQAGAVAQGQTQHEAEVLAMRLRDVVQTQVIEDVREDYTQKAREAKRGHAGMAGAGLMIGHRAQVMDGSGEWVYGTIASIDHSRFGVVCDDGTWLPGVPIEQVQ